MKKLLLFVSALVCLIAANGFAVDYSITKLIEVGPASSVPFLGPLKWSPDGTKLAFFKGKTLMLTDTLGNVTTVKEINSPVHRYEWATNSLLALHYRSFPRNEKGSFNQLVTIDISNQRETIVAEYQYKPSFLTKEEYASFTGPFLTHGKTAFYEIESSSGQATGAQTLGRHFFDATKAAQGNSDDFILRWRNRKDIYKVYLDGRDSVMLYDNPAWDGAPSVLRADGKYLIASQFFVDLSTGIALNMRDFAGPLPANTYGCSFSNASFIPNYPEALFHQACDDGHDILAERAVIFNYDTNDFLVLDTLVGLSTCKVPVIHTSGNIIAFLSDGKLYITELGRETE